MLYMIYDYSENMEKIVIECKDLTRFHVKKEDGELMKRIIQMCQSYNLEIKVY